MKKYNLHQYTLYLVFWLMSASNTGCMEQETSKVIAEAATSIGSLDLKGTYECVIDSKKYLSPFHGWVWLESGLIERYYRFGNIQTERSANDMVVTRILGGDATIQLVHQLFHAVGSDFAHVKEWSYPAAYFDATILGKILATVDNILTKTKKPKKAVFTWLLTNLISTHIEKVRFKKIGSHQKTITLLKEAFSNLKALIPAQEGLLESITHTPLATWLGKDVDSTANEEYLIGHLIMWANHIRSSKAKAINNSLRFVHRTGPGRRHQQGDALIQKQHSLQRAHGYLVELYKKFNKPQNAQGIKKLAHAYYNVLKQSRKARARSSELATLIINAYQEAGQFADQSEEKPSLYPPHTPTNILLASLCAIAENKKDFIAYFEQFTKPIIKKDAQELLSTSFTKTTSVVELEKSFLQRTRGNKNPQSIIENLYEETCHTGISEINHAQLTPPMIKFTSVNFFDHDFQACSEIAILNFIRILLTQLDCYDRINHSFDVSNLQKKIGILLNNKNQTANNDEPPLIKLFTQQPQEGQAQNKGFQQLWAELVSDIPGVKYLRRYDKKNKTSKKENEKPALHEIAEQDYGSQEHEALDAHWYLYELSGYPDTVARTVSYVLGFRCDTLKELCNIFDITPDEPLDETFSDDSMYNSLINDTKIPSRILSIPLQSTITKFKLACSTGHLEFAHYTSGLSTKLTVYRPLLNNFYAAFKIPEMRNMASCFAAVDEISYQRSPAGIEERAFLQHYILMQNLSYPPNLLNGIKRLMSKSVITRAHPLYGFITHLIKEAQKCVLHKIIDFTDLLEVLIPSANFQLSKENLRYIVNLVDANKHSINNDNRSKLVKGLLQLFTYYSSSNLSIDSIEELKTLLNKQITNLPLNTSLSLVTRYWDQNRRLISNCTFIPQLLNDLICKSDLNELKSLADMFQYSMLRDLLKFNNVATCDYKKAINRLFAALCTCEHVETKANCSLTQRINRWGNFDYELCKKLWPFLNQGNKQLLIKHMTEEQAEELLKAIPAEKGRYCQIL